VSAELFCFPAKARRHGHLKSKFHLNKMVMKTTSERRDMYAIINNMIMDKLKNAKMRWKQTWNDYGPARNYVGKKPYRFGKWPT
jgi:hypothetical protein